MGAGAAGSLRCVVCGLFAPELAVNPSETTAMAAIAAIRFPNTIRSVSPQGPRSVNSHSRMS